jgi:hypothetical protein
MGAGKISYKVEETPSGGRVIIITTDPKSLEAVREFLRFRIAEHKAGDSTAVQ